MNLCIDASNIRSGGGLTHLVEMLNAAEPENYGFSRVVVWGGEKTLVMLPSRPWLKKINPVELNRGLLFRAWWQRFDLSDAARAEQCDILFVPGGSFAGSFKPVVTMSQNLLPFEWAELQRYGCSLTTLRFLLLRYVQTRTFQHADGLIFLTEYARKAVLQVTGSLANETTIIPHGLNPRFQIEPKDQRSILEYTDLKPYRLLYVSIVDQYKHQWHVVEAVHALREEGLPLVLDLVGPAYPPALSRLKTVISSLDPEGRWAHYRGSVPYEELHKIYEQADLGIFASSCENLPIILLESMAAGLPIVCSNRGPMPEVLGDTGLYFDPENAADLAQVLRKFICSIKLRTDKVKASFERCQQYSWTQCADQTFSYLANLASRNL